MSRLSLPALTFGVTLTLVRDPEAILRATGYAP